MRKFSLLYAGFAALLVLAFMHFLATLFYFYWTVSWWDNMVHFLGGVSIGILSLWLWWDVLWRRRPSPVAAYLSAIVFVMIIGAGWEIFEYVYNIANPSTGESYFEDTFHDLIADFLGSILAGLVAVKSFTTSKR